MTANRFLPLRKSRLPTTDAIIGYLREIDRNEWYSNFGALHNRLEGWLAQHLGVEPENIVGLANGTAGLILSLLARNAPAGSLCAMPSFTFAAVPQAALGAGLIPWFVDVDPATWMPDPAAVAVQLERAPGPVGALIVVSPFGPRVDMDGWSRFEAETGVPVIVDAAWAIDNATITHQPSMISLHATKVLGIGEGGLVASLDADLIADIRCRANFGFGSDRLSHLRGGNFKLSEYGAAVGLAAFDLFPELRQEALRVAADYIEAFSDVEGIRIFPGFDGTWASAIFAVEFDEPKAQALVPHLADAGIEARCWWGTPCHEHPPFGDFPRTDLPGTKSLASRALNLPFHSHLDRTDVLRVRDTTVALYRASD